MPDKEIMNGKSEKNQERNLVKNQGTNLEENRGTNQEINHEVDREEGKYKIITIELLRQMAEKEQPVPPKIDLE